MDRTLNDAINDFFKIIDQKIQEQKPGKLIKKEGCMKAWCISEAVFEYDDCRYNEMDGGSPIKVFKNQARALEELARAKFEWLQENDVYDYREGILEVLSESLVNKLREIVTVFNVTHDTNYNLDDDDNFDVWSSFFKHYLSTLSFEAAQDILPHVSLNPFRLSEIVLVDE
jgi:hypothetical protein